MTFPLLLSTNCRSNVWETGRHLTLPSFRCEPWVVVSAAGFRLDCWHSHVFWIQAQSPADGFRLQSPPWAGEFRHSFIHFFLRVASANFDYRYRLGSGLDTQQSSAVTSVSILGLQARLTADTFRLLHMYVLSGPFGRRTRSAAADSGLCRLSSGGL